MRSVVFSVILDAQIRVICKCLVSVHTLVNFTMPCPSLYFSKNSTRLILETSIQMLMWRMQYKYHLTQHAFPCSLFTTILLLASWGAIVLLLRYCFVFEAILL